MSGERKGKESKQINYRMIISVNNQNTSEEAIASKGKELAIISMKSSQMSTSKSRSWSWNKFKTKNTNFPNQITIPWAKSSKIKSIPLTVQALKKIVNMKGPIDQTTSKSLDLETISEKSKICIMIVDKWNNSKLMNPWSSGPWMSLWMRQEKRKKLVHYKS